MYTTYAKPLHLEPGPSRYLAGWLLLVHLTALLIVSLLNLSVWLIVIFVTAVLINLGYSWRRYIWRTHPQAIQSITWQGAGELTVRYHSDKALQARLLQRALILPWLVILHFRIAGHSSHTLLLTPDMLAEDAFRRLRVRLRMAMDGARV